MTGEPEPTSSGPCSPAAYPRPRSSPHWPAPRYPATSRAASGKAAAGPVPTALVAGLGPPALGTLVLLAGITLEEACWILRNDARTDRISRMLAWRGNAGCLTPDGAVSPSRAPARRPGRRTGLERGWTASATNRTVSVSMTTFPALHTADDLPGVRERAVRAGPAPALAGQPRRQQPMRTLARGEPRGSLPAGAAPGELAVTLASWRELRTLLMAGTTASAARASRVQSCRCARPDLIARP